MAKSPTEQLLQELESLRARGLVTDEEYAARRQAILSGQVAPPPAKSGGGFFKKVGIGCGALIGIVIVIAIIAAAAGGGSGDDDSDTAASSGGTPGAGTNRGDVHVTLAPGVSGEIAPDGSPERKSRVTIVQIQDPVVSTNPFSQPKAGMRWIGIEVIHENVGTKEVSSLDWKLRDTNDNEHEEDVIGPVVDLPDLDPIYSDLTPGGKKQGWIYFQVPEGAGIKWLRADPNTFLKNDLYFDAP
ncbi:DUF4352 domain-containing protein [Tepidiforma sp.]|uniref:DUF4352 domain-containing protein n=1 Tax=Tepidiforma sp. TaxID=2682230 RepID=UPI002ADD7DC0|nr:DUF4352 domain-containing protein [Tepidiforma sp.]